MLLDVDLSGSFHVIHRLVFELEGRVVAASFSSSCLSKAQSLQLRARTWDKMSKPWCPELLGHQIAAGIHRHLDCLDMSGCIVVFQA